MKGKTIPQSSTLAHQRTKRAAVIHERFKLNPPSQKNEITTNISSIANSEAKNHTQKPLKFPLHLQEFEHRFSKSQS